MKGRKPLGMFFLVMALALAVICPARGWERTGDRGADVNYPPLAKSAGEQKILSVLKELEKAPLPFSVDPLHGRLLRILIEAVGAKQVVEIGAANGYSALWICLGLQATGGRLVTHEIDPNMAAQARANFKRAGVEHLVTVVAGDAHETVRRLKDPIDLLFIDADKGGYLDYLNKLLPQVRPGGLILADNMSRPAPQPAFVKAITTNPDLETIFLNMESTGISLTVKKR